LSICFFNYSGTKLKYASLINEYINLIQTKQNAKIYIEPFLGSGSVFFNLESEFDEYILNDIDRNIIRIFQSFKDCSYDYYYSKCSEISNKFGSMKEKENYYTFRKHFNTHHWNSNSLDEGIYLHLLANSCINSMLRFGPNGMNQGSGKREKFLTEDEFNCINSKLKKATLTSVSYKELLNMDALYFLDPPYYSCDSSYASFSEKDLIEFVELIQDKHYVYTDILNDLNDSIPFKQKIRTMRTSAPSSNKKQLGIHEEYIFVSENINKDW